MPRTVTALALLLLSLPLTAPHARAGEKAPSGEPASPLAFLEPFTGPWIPHPDWEPLKKNPMLRRLVPINLQWGGGGGFLYIEEGLPQGREYDAVGIVVWNPVSSRADFLARQRGGDFIFDGHYEPIDAQTVRRIYDVIDPKGGVRVFRETLHLRKDGIMEWTTEQKKDGVFEHVRGKPGPEFHAIRPSAEPSTELDGLAMLIGNWRPDPARIPARMKAWREENGVEDGSVSFAWGTANRWIEFGEHRKQAGAWRVEGAGLIAWDPRSRSIVYREHSDSGVTLEGTIEKTDALTIKRHYRAARPDGSVSHWEDTWQWRKKEDDCFQWTTTRIVGAAREARPARWMCRIPAAEESRGKPGGN